MPSPLLSFLNVYETPFSTCAKTNKNSLLCRLLIVSKKCRMRHFFEFSAFLCAPVCTAGKRRIERTAAVHAALVRVFFMNNQIDQNLGF